MNLIFALLMSSVTTYAGPEAYPGSFWGTVTNDFHNVEGWGSQGVLTQGIQWFTLPGDAKFSTYGAYSGRFRSNNRDYYDAHGPSLGAAISWHFLNLGWEYQWTKYPHPEPANDFQNSMVYLSWYKRLYLADRAPTTTWGRVFRDSKNLEGSGMMGWISQGYELFYLPHEIVLKPLVVYRWRYRSENQRYYDVAAPGAGIEFSRHSTDLGVEYSWAHYPGLGTTVAAWHLYLTWYFDWDLKKRDEIQP